MTHLSAVRSLCVVLDDIILVGRRDLDHAESSTTQQGVPFG